MLQRWLTRTIRKNTLCYGTKTCGVYFRDLDNLFFFIHTSEILTSARRRAFDRLIPVTRPFPRPGGLWSVCAASTVRHLRGRLYGYYLTPCRVFINRVCPNNHKDAKKWLWKNYKIPYKSLIRPDGNRIRKFRDCFFFFHHQLTLDAQTFISIYFGHFKQDFQVFTTTRKAKHARVIPFKIKYSTIYLFTIP